MRSVLLTLSLVLVIAQAQLVQADRYAGDGEDSDLGARLSLDPQTPPPSLGDDDQARRAFEQTPAASQPAPLPPRAAARSRTTTSAMAEILLKQLSSVPDGVTLPGRTISLAEVVRDAPTRRAQTDRISAYWDLSYAVADFYLAAREATEFDGIARRAGLTAASFESEELAMKTRLAATKQAVVLAQARLKRLLGSYESPIPTDLPLCGSYETNYARIFAGDPSEAAASVEAAQSLDQLIPLRYQQVLSDAATVERGYQELTNASNQALKVEASLAAHKSFSLARRAFLKTVYDYNHDIAEYSQLARPQRLAANRLVAMHIGTAGEVFLGADSNVLPATAVEPIEAGRRESRRPIVEEEDQPEETSEELPAEQSESSPEEVAEEETSTEDETQEAVAANSEAESTDVDEAGAEDSPSEEADAAEQSDEPDKKITVEELFDPTE